MAIQTHKVWGLIIATGKSEKLSSGSDTAFIGLGDKPMLAYSLQAMESCEDIDGVVAVVPRERMEMVKSLSKLFGFNKLRKIVGGSGGRAALMQSGLKAMEDDITLVVVQKVSYPFVKPSTISETVRVAKRYGCAVAAGKVDGCLKISSRGNRVVKTQDAGGLWLAQSPQTYRRELLELVVRDLGEDDQDESEVLEKQDKEVRLVQSPQWNIKVATGDDLALAGTILHMDFDQRG